MTAAKLRAILTLNWCWKHSLPRRAELDHQCDKCYIASVSDELAIVIGNCIFCDKEGQAEFSGDPGLFLHLIPIPWCGYRALVCIRCADDVRAYLSPVMPSTVKQITMAATRIHQFIGASPEAQELLGLQNLCLACNRPERNPVHKFVAVEKAPK